MAEGKRRQWTLLTSHNFKTGSWFYRRFNFALLLHEIQVHITCVSNQKKINKPFGQTCTHHIFAFFSWLIYLQWNIFKPCAHFFVWYDDSCHITVFIDKLFYFLMNTEWAQYYILFGYLNSAHRNSRYSYDIWIQNG